MSRAIRIADLFCGAGGTSTGAVQAAEVAGYRVDLTAVNHWPIAVETHSVNHPSARHVCAAVDSINPRHLYPDGRLDILWASPECTHHSRARGGRPMSDQSRASGHCVTRWAEALRPGVILVENVREFEEWGPIGDDGRPIQRLRGATFRAWVGVLESLGYRVDWRVLCAADYGDPTTRQRLFVQAVRGRRRIAWPTPTHSREPELLAGQRWRPASEIIDWSIPAPPIAGRKRPLAARTMQRIEEGLRRYRGQPTIVAMEHGGRTVPATAPLPTVTCARGGAFGLSYLLPQQSDGVLRPTTQPAPTVATAGAIALVVEYYGNGSAQPVTKPLPTVTCVDRFALIQAIGDRVGFRMLQPHELAGAQGFPSGYRFAGTKSDAVRQIGNAVPCGLARALVNAVLKEDEP